MLAPRALTTILSLCLVALTPGDGFTQDATDIVLHAASASCSGSQWTVVENASAAGGARLQNANAGTAKVTRSVAIDGATRDAATLNRCGG